jgi:hypothetical protein
VPTRMAEVLRGEVEELTGPGGGDGEEGQRVYESAAEIERAMMGYEAIGASIGGRDPGARAAAAHLQARASAAYPWFQATRYDGTGRILSTLIREAEAAGGDDQEACSVRAMVYDTTAALLHRVGETSLAWTAAERAPADADAVNSSSSCAIMERTRCARTTRGKVHLALPASSPTTTSPSSSLTSLTPPSRRPARWGRPAALRRRGCQDAVVGRRPLACDPSTPRHDRPVWPGRRESAKEPDGPPPH